MAFHIRNPATEARALKLASLKGLGPPETVLRAHSFAGFSASTM